MALTLRLAFDMNAVDLVPDREQIEALTGKTEREPGNGSLYLGRSALHRIHGDWAFV